MSKSIPKFCNSPGGEGGGEEQREAKGEGESGRGGEPQYREVKGQKICQLE